MTIHGPSNHDYDIDLGPVLLSDCKEDRSISIDLANICQITTRNIFKSWKKVRAGSDSHPPRSHVDIQQ